MLIKKQTDLIGFTVIKVKLQVVILLKRFIFPFFRLIFDKSPSSSPIYIINSLLKLQHDPIISDLLKIICCGSSYKAI